MRNLRQRLVAFTAATLLAVIIGGVSPAYADGVMGGPTKNTCAFVAGMFFRVPPDSAAASVFKAILVAYDCD